MERVYERNCPEVLLVCIWEMGATEHDLGRIFEGEHMKADRRVPHTINRHLLSVL